MTTNTKNCLRLIQQYHSLVKEIMDENYLNGHPLSDDQEKRANRCLKQTRELENWTVSGAQCLLDEIRELKSKIRGRDIKLAKERRKAEEQRIKAEGAQRQTEAERRKFESTEKERRQAQRDKRDNRELVIRLYKLLKELFKIIRIHKIELRPILIMRLTEAFCTTDSEYLEGKDFKHFLNNINQE